ncbi:unnamed protein product [Symbiodinium sp. CCMP2592]|nr:unnamed protein product [Symbiodinium sp. CCMP2592]
MAPKAKRAGSKKTRTLKRPAAAKPRARPEPVLPNITEDKFCLKTFISDLWRALNIRKTDKASWSVLEVATSCSGVGTPIHCLGMMLGKEWIRELYAVEQDPAAAQFLMTNFEPLHVFQEAADIKNGRGMCWRHGCSCDVPSGEQIFVAGFSCKAFSVQNPGRFSEDASAKAHVTLQACQDTIQLRKPHIVLLENTSGLRCVSGGGNQDPLLNTVMERLAASSGPDRVTKCVMGDASPLPCARKRMLFYNAETTVAQRLEDMHKRLHERCQAMPKHCVSSMLEPLNLVTSASEGMRVTEKADFESRYHTAFSKQLAKAVHCARLPSDVKIPKVRPSKQFSHALTAWECAQIDIFGLMLDHQISKEGSSGNGRPKLADVSQSPNRGTLFTQGTCATVCTSSKWYEHESQTVISPVSFFKIHGHHMKKLKGCEVGHTFSAADIRRFAGNGMACTMMVCALTPCLLELGYLQHVPASS